MSFTQHTIQKNNASVTHTPVFNQLIPLFKTRNCSIIAEFQLKNCFENNAQFLYLREGVHPKKHDFDRTDGLKGPPSEPTFGWYLRSQIHSEKLNSANEDNILNSGDQ